MYYFTAFMLLVHTFLGLILIGIILLQRGRGGGLAGAFGGMGGQSAFGTKAGDVFTKITIYLATAWIVLGGVCVLLASNSKEFKGQSALAADGEKKVEDSKSKEDGKGDADVVPGPGPANPPDTKTDVKDGDKKDDATKVDGEKKDDVKKDGEKKDETKADGEKKDDVKKDETSDGPKPGDKSDAKDAPVKPVVPPAKDDAEKPADPPKKESPAKDPVEKPADKPE